jgi:hypothetical protein
MMDFCQRSPPPSQSEIAEPADGKNFIQRGMYTRASMFCTTHFASRNDPDGNVLPARLASRKPGVVKMSVENAPQSCYGNCSSH